MNEQPTTRASRRALDDPTGTVIAGRYVIQRVIARGGMATVYLAEDSLLSRPVAVKVFSDGADADDQDSFLQEARAVAKLSHPNIVDIYDAGVEGALRFIVMQYVPGGTLRDVVQREAPLDPRRAVEVTMKLADALNFGHTRGIVHCDVKPGNVLLGDQGEPKIVDFGIARSLTATADLSDTIAGTVGYISPEQVEGGSIDGRADVYSLAAVLYEMLTGTPPYSGDNLMAVATQRLVKPPVSVREKNPFVPEELNEIVMRGLARDPGARYPTAKSFADDLRTYLGSLTDATTRRMARPTAVPTGDVTERISLGQRPAVGTAAEDAEARGGRRGRTWLFVAIAGTLVAVVVALIVVLAVALTGGDDPGPTVTVPQVTGQRVDDASNRIRDAGLEVGDVTLRSDQAPFGQVIEQRPAAGEPLESGRPVELIISVGAEPP